MWPELGHNSELLTPYTSKHNFWNIQISVTCNLKSKRMEAWSWIGTTWIYCFGDFQKHRPPFRAFQAPMSSIRACLEIAQLRDESFLLRFLLRVVRKVKQKADAADACGRNGIEWLLHGQWSLQQAPEASKNVSWGALLPWKFWIKTMTCLKTCE